jgi:putative oxidoreductase
MPSPLTEAAALAGRLLLAAIFLHEAWSKLTGYAGALAYMHAFGVPGELLPLAIAVEAGCGLLILVGYHTRAAALMLAAFCVVAAVLFHTRFGDRNQLLHFEKDFAIAGGLLVLFAHGGGAWALDALRLGTGGRLGIGKQRRHPADPLVPDPDRSAASGAGGTPFNLLALPPSGVEPFGLPRD